MMTSTGDAQHFDVQRDRGRRPAPWSNPPQAEILDLIRRADHHTLGREFLARGAQDAVAATFGVHAFLVDAAREHLARDPYED